MAPRIKILGRDDDLLLAIGAIVVGIGVIAYIATAVTEEAQRRWTQAVAGGGTALGFVLGLPYGRKKSRDEGFDEGFWEPNPAITIDGRLNARDAGRLARGGGSAVAGMVGNAVVSSATAGVSGVVDNAVRGVVANAVMDRFTPRGPSTETLPPVMAPPGFDPRVALEGMTVAQLRKLAREQGRGGDGLSSATKAEIIDRMLIG